MKNNKPYISIKIVYKDKKVKQVSTRKTRRIFSFIKANDFQNCVIWLSVMYGLGEFNKGLYKSKTDLIRALKAFLE